MLIGDRLSGSPGAGTKRSRRSAALSGHDLKRWIVISTNNQSD
jgi:hypothetical protein